MKKSEFIRNAEELNTFSQGFGAKHVNECITCRINRIEVKPVNDGLRVIDAFIGI